MKVTVVASLLTKWNMNINTSQNALNLIMKIYN